MASLSWALRRSRATSLWSIAAFLAAAMTGIAVYSYLSWLRAQVPVAGALVPVVVASMDSPPGTVISTEHVQMAKHPEHYLPPAALGSLDDVLGQVATVPLFEGEVITRRKIGTEGGLSSVVPPGMRAYSVQVTSGTSLGFLPRIGDRVDVIATLPREVMGEATTITILEGAEVAAVGGSSGEDSGRVADQLGLDTAAAAMQITLYVSSEDAERLAMAESLGRITIVLAPSADEGAEPRPIRPSDLVGD